MPTFNRIEQKIALADFNFVVSHFHNNYLLNLILLFPYLNHTFKVNMPYFSASPFDDDKFAFFSETNLLR